MKFNPFKIFQKQHIPPVPEPENSASKQPDTEDDVTDNSAEFVLNVQDLHAITDRGCVAIGVVESGSITPGSKIILECENRTYPTIVKGIDLFGDKNMGVLLPEMEGVNIPSLNIKRIRSAGQDTF